MTTIAPDYVKTDMGTFKLHPRLSKLLPVWQL